MKDIFKVWNRIISNFFLRASKIFRVLVPPGLSKNRTNTASFKTPDIYAIRFLDILGAIIGLVLSSLLFLILPILIKLDSKGPVFYTQLRVGRNRRKKDHCPIEAEILNDKRKGDRRQNNAYGKPFVIYKFRTMKEGAEKKCGPVLTSYNDPRITRMGQILRYSHLDDLPQLINILKGDMSFVGPKPERPYLVNRFIHQIPAYVERFCVRPGLTGLAQMKIGSGYSDDEVMEKLDYDLAYCNHGSLKSYFSIIILTLIQPLIAKK